MAAKRARQGPVASSHVSSRWKKAKPRVTGDFEFSVFRPSDRNRESSPRNRIGSARTTLGTRRARTRSARKARTRRDRSRKARTRRSRFRRGKKARRVTATLMRWQVVDLLPLEELPLW